MTRFVAKPNASGFTLLEVIVAMALTGFILGSLFTLVAGSKQLSWRSESSLIEASKLRAAVNFALLQDDYSDVEPVLVEDVFQSRALAELEPPLRKTQASNYILENIEIQNTETNETVTGSRWVRLTLQQQ